MITIKQPAAYDVSHWKNIPDFQAVSPRPLLFITKATEHITFVDEDFAAFFAGMESIGCKRGAYHFFRRAFDPVRQAKHFCKTIYPHVIDDDILILDVEEGGETAAMLWAFLEEVRRQYPRNLLMIYSSAKYLNPIPMTAGEREYFRKIPVWIAGYPTFPDLWDEPLSGYIPDPAKWGEVWLWQYSAHGAVTGIEGDVDLNWMSPALIDYLGGTIPPELPTDEETENTMTIYKGTVITTVTLQIRSGPGISYDKVGELKPGDKVEADAQIGGWWHLTRITRAGVDVPVPADGYAYSNNGAYIRTDAVVTEPPTSDAFPPRVGLTFDGTTIKWYVAE